MEIERKLHELGITLPDPPASAGAYVTCKQTGNQVYLSGQGPILNGENPYYGKVGEKVSKEEAYQTARRCGLNLLAQLKAYLGDLDRVSQVVQVKGYVACSSTFFDQPQVVNGVSDLMIEVFGERGKHTRCALGTNVLPGDIPVEVEMIVEIDH